MVSFADDNSRVGAVAGDFVVPDTKMTNRTAVIVLGMHRSGTSALTRVINLFGAQLPSLIIGKNSSNQVGHWESSRLVSLHERLLTDCASAWYDWRPLDLTRMSFEKRAAYKSDIGDVLARDYSSARVIVVKDPRISRFTPLFIEALAEAGYTSRPILIFRNPIEVIDSVLTRAANWNEATKKRLWPADFSRAEAALLWLDCNLRAEEVLRKNGGAIVNYENLVNDWRSAMSVVLETCGETLSYTLAEAAPQVDQFITSDLHHERAKMGDVALDPVLRGWVNTLYEALLVLSVTPDSQSAKDRIDAVRTEFANATPIIESMLASVRIEKDQIRSKLSEDLAIAHKLSEERQQQLSRLQSEIAVLTDEKQAAGERISLLEKEALENESAIEELRKNERSAADLQLAEFHTEIIELRRVADMERQGLLAQIDNLKTEHDSVRQENISYLELSENQQLQLSQLQSELAALTDDKKAADERISLLEKEAAEKASLIDDREQIAGFQTEIIALRRAADMEREDLLARIDKLKTEREQTNEFAVLSNARLTQMQAERDDLLEEIGARTTELESFRLVLDEQAGEIGQLVETLAEAQADKSQAHAAITLLKKERDRFAENGLEQEKSFRKIKRERDERDSRIRDLTYQIKTYESRIRSLERGIAKARTRVSEIETTFRSSKSWKLTAPFRLIASIPSVIYRAPSVIRSSIAIGGGFKPTIGKVARILKAEGWSGIRSRVAFVNKHAERAKKKPAITKQPVERSVHAQDPMKVVNEPRPAVTSPSADVSLIKKSGLFDRQFYSQKARKSFEDDDAAIRHYLDSSVSWSISPGPHFHIMAYAQANRELIAEGEHPLLHYLQNHPMPQLVASPTFNPGRIAVYTANISDYDQLADPGNSDTGADYFVFTDGDVPKDCVWQRRELDYINADPTRTARFYKVHPHLYFADYDYSIWMDSNLLMRASPEAIVEAVGHNKQFSAWHHPIRDCVYDEADECRQRRKDEDILLLEQAARYRSEGYPKHNGLFETSVLVRRHNDAEVVAAMADWWREIDNGSKRDQIGLMKALKGHQLQIGHVAQPGICMRSDPRFLYRKHNG